MALSPPGARPEVDADRTKNRTGGEGDVEPPAARSKPDAEVDQEPGDAHASTSVSPRPDQQTANPEPGFTRTFPNVKEFLAFAKAEFRPGARGPRSVGVAGCLLDFCVGFGVGCRGLTSSSPQRGPPSYRHQLQGGPLGAQRRHRPWRGPPP